jgi:hypothetical protein
MEHSLHLSAKHFVQAVAPSSPQKIARKIKNALRNAEMNGEVNLDMLDEELAGFSFDDGDNNECEGEGEGGSEDDAMDLDAGDSLGKALALVGQVSPCLP